MQMSDKPKIYIGAHRGYFPARRFYEIPANPASRIIVFKGPQAHLDEGIFIKGRDGAFSCTPFKSGKSSVEARLTAAMSEAEAILREYLGDDWFNVANDLDLSFLCGATAATERTHPRNAELRAKLSPFAIEHLIDALELEGSIIAIATNEHTVHEIMYLCVHLGLVWQRMRLRRYEEYAITGQKTKTSASRGGRATKRLKTEQEALIREEYASMKQEGQQVGVIKSRLAKKYDVSVQTINRALKS
jgi:hypothetical protein